MRKSGVYITMVWQAQDVDGNRLTPFFPKKEFAEYFAVNKWNESKAELSLLRPGLLV